VSTADVLAARWVARRAGADWDAVLRLAHAQATACRRAKKDPPAAVAVLEREYWRRCKQRAGTGAVKDAATKGRAA
jgi:hypothetical protein